MIPTGIALLYQFSGIFTGTNAMGEETGIAIGFAKVWSNYSKSIPLSIIMGMALPIGVLFLNLVFDFKNIKSNRYYWFAWLHCCCFNSHRTTSLCGLTMASPISVIAASKGKAFLHY